MTDWLSPEARRRLDAERERKTAEQVAGLDLFMPRDNGTPTSKAAAEYVAPHCRGMRRRVLEVLVAYGPMTREEIAEASGMKKDSVNGRSFECVRAGWVREDGERDGQAVLKITEAGLAALHHEQQEAA